MYEIFEQLLQRFGITAYKVSKDTGIPQSTLSSWKSKKNKISLEHAEILANYFNVSIDYLMTGNENQNGSCYYLNDETRKIAQEIFDTPELMELFDLCRNLQPKQLKIHVDFIKRLYESENE